MEQHEIEPARILAITFTEKAATEIKERLVKRFAGRPDLREKVERAWVETIDGFCTRLLMEHSLAANLPPDFSILDESKADRMEREAAEEALDSLFQEHPARMRVLLEALDLSTSDDSPSQDLAAALLDVYEAQRVSGVAPRTGFLKNADRQPFSPESQDGDHEPDVGKRSLSPFFKKRVRGAVNC